MIPKPLADLAVEVASNFGDEEVVKRDPEAYLVSLLTDINDRLKYTGATLSMAIQLSGFEESMAAARQLLDEETSQASSTTHAAKQ